MTESIDHIHTQLDRSTLEWCGWLGDLSDEKILESLLALNLEGAGGD